MKRQATRLGLAALLALPLAGTALAEHKHASHEVHKHHQAAAAVSEAATLIAGEVRKVDRSAGEIILKHARIKSMDMPAMTMGFNVKDSAMLDQVKVGDKVRFAAEIIGGQPTITKLAPTASREKAPAARREKLAQTTR